MVPDRFLEATANHRAQEQYDLWYQRSVSGPLYGEGVGVGPGKMFLSTFRTTKNVPKRGLDLAAAGGGRKSVSLPGAAIRSVTGLSACTLGLNCNTLCESQ